MRSAAETLLPPLVMKSSTRLRKSVEYAIIINSNINLKKCKLIFGIHYNRHYNDLVASFHGCMVNC